MMWSIISFIGTIAVWKDPCSIKKFFVNSLLIQLFWSTIGKYRTLLEFHFNGFTNNYLKLIPDWLYRDKNLFLAM
jgi:hypothetical protein